MHVTYRKDYSQSLHRDMEVKVYGHRGKPVVVFPTSDGRFFQYEEFGMLETLRPFIDRGAIQVWCIDGIDQETLTYKGHDIWGAMWRYGQYLHYVAEELIPFITHHTDTSSEVDGWTGDRHKVLVTGCSLGAFHAANFFFRYPNRADAVIALSGVYSTRDFFGEYMPPEVRENSPLDYLHDHIDEWKWLDYQSSRIVLCCGQGAWEDQMIRDTVAMRQLLADRSIPACVDLWGHDVDHDWPWWHKQIVHYLNQVLEVHW